jgi:hypothetical protein
MAQLLSQTGELPDTRRSYKIRQRASRVVAQGPLRDSGSRLWRCILTICLLGGISIGCSQRDDDDVEARRAPASADTVIVLAPVLNLSDSTAFDPLQLTDILAGEMQRFEGVAVVPVNLTLAALARLGKSAVETPEDARAIAQEFDADATVVAAVTEYDPYMPPRVGLVLQWYAASPPAHAAFLNPVTASRQMNDIGVHALSVDAQEPVFQVQQHFDASENAVQREVRDFARARRGADSPYGWRLYLESQKHFVRYCAWSSIRTMLQVHRNNRLSAMPNEAEQ